MTTEREAECSPEDMCVSIVVTGTEAEQRALQILECAEACHYKLDEQGEPLPGQTIPGDDERFVMNNGSLRVVFSFTEVIGRGTYRHLSVTSKASSLPAPPAVWTLAEMFGFTGCGERNELGLVTERGATWSVGLQDERIVVVMQKVEPAN